MANGKSKLPGAGPDQGRRPAQDPHLKADVSRAQDTIRAGVPYSSLTMRERYITNPSIDGNPKYMADRYRGREPLPGADKPDPADDLPAPPRRPVTRLGNVAPGRTRR